jgi:mannose-6-phosphate isomerase
MHQVERTSSSLRSWLLDRALPLWWSRGADRELGGFHERLRQDATPTGEDRRSRLHPRQIYAFAVGHDLGWAAHGAAAVRHGLRFYLAHYRRSDGLFLRLVANDGQPRRTDVVLYDQAFALLGLAAGYRLLRDESLRECAIRLLDAVGEHLRHDEQGFTESSAGDQPLLSNSHMHLFEAAIAWMEFDTANRWQQLARQLATLASTRFVDPSTGFLLEFFDGAWRPLGQDARQRVEPGHQYEWAWLLSRWSILSGDAQAQKLALVLFERAETHGIDRARHVAINALTPNGGVMDANARLWPQTERLKAAAVLGELTRNYRYWAIALESADALARYLDVPRTGLWRDTLTPDGTFLDEPAPASSLYHIAGAIAQMDRSVRRASAASDRVLVEP